MASDQESSIARVYARSLLELAESRGEAESIRQEVDSLLELLDRNEEVEAVLATPLVATEERQQFLEAVFGDRMSELLIDTLQVMNRKGRAVLVRAFAHSYVEELEKAHNIIEVRVTSAVGLSDDQRSRLALAIEKTTGMKARLNETEDRSLLGGLVLQVGDRKIDSSVATELQRLRSRFLDRGSQELQGEHTHVIEAE